MLSAKVKVRHIEHKNPAAMADAFCDAPNIFDNINKASHMFYLSGHLAKVGIFATA